MKLIQTLRHKYALSEQGARDMIKACLSCTAAYITLMLPVGLLYFLVADMLAGHAMTPRRQVVYIAGTVACVLLIAVTSYIQYNATFFSTYRESGIRRITLAERLRRLPLSFFGKKDLADLTGTMMADCAALETASSHWIPELIGALVANALMSVALLFYDWRMAIAALWVLPVSFLIVLLSTHVQNILNRKQMKVKMICADGIQECLETLRDLRANNAEMAYLSGLDRKIKDVERRAIRCELGTAVFVISAEMVLKLGIVTVALAGGLLLVGGQIDVLTFFVFLLLASRLYDPLIASLIHLASIIGINVQTERMNEILEHPLQTGKDQLSNSGYDMVFSHVNFAYDTSETVLQDVSFTARQGEVTALIGPSGGGKTTLARLAARFWDVDSGTITVGGMDIAQIDPERLLSLYSIVFQDVVLFNDTVMENIRIGRKDATDAEVIEAAKMAHCDDFVRLLPQQWDTPIGENGSQLSGGERQRISLARAFLKSAPIILLDEATASLDVENETRIQEALSKLIRDKTVLIIAHRMRTVNGADKIVALRDGRVCQQGSPAQLMVQGGLYREMVEQQMQAAGKCDADSLVSH